MGGAATLADISDAVRSGATLDLTDLVMAALATAPATLDAADQRRLEHHNLALATLASKSFDGRPLSLIHI